MQRFRMGELFDLLPATEAVSNKDRCGTRRSNSWEQILVGDGARNLEFVGFKSKGARHAAAPGLDRLDGSASLSKNRDFVRRSAEDRLVVAMAVNENVCPLESPREEIRRIRC